MDRLGVYHCVCDAFGEEKPTIIVSRTHAEAVESFIDMLLEQEDQLRDFLRKNIYVEEEGSTSRYDWSKHHGDRKLEWE